MFKIEIIFSSKHWKVKIGQYDKQTGQLLNIYNSIVENVDFSREEFMKITILDRSAMGMDIPLEQLEQFGEVAVFDSTSKDNAIERIVDSDVIILNKVKITRDIIEASRKLKLICVFATGYDNIDIKAAEEKTKGRWMRCRLK